MSPRLFRDRSSALSAGLTAALLTGMEVADVGRRSRPGDQVADDGTAHRFLAALAGAMAVTAIDVASDRPLPRNRALWWSGLACTWTGIALNRMARRHLGSAYRARLTVVDDHPVVRSGPFRAVRHPMYLGSTAICAGIGTAIGRPRSMGAWMLPVVALVHRIGVEEAMLRRALGPAYEDYARGRARLVPRIW